MRPHSKFNRHKPILIAALISPFTACLAPGQSPPEFEVASVKLATSGSNGVRGGCHGIDSRYSPGETAEPPLGRCVITDGRLSHLIMAAYGVPVGNIKDAPEWVMSGTERFTIEAKAETAHATEQQLREMLQTLLADRFKLRFHREDRDLPGFALTVAKNGVKLRPATGDEVVTSFGASVKPVKGQPVTLIARRYSMAMLANLLSQTGAGPLVDQTGLTGNYDFRLSWDDDAGPVLATALQEQLGLRFEPRKVPVSFFIFESAQRPLPN